MKLGAARRGRFPGAGDGPTACALATIDRPRFTRWGEADRAVEDGFVVPPEGATLIAVAHRHGRADSRPRVGFLTGWGAWRGAFATTVSHDSHNLTVFGGNAADMAVAANAVIAAGGGMAVASGGKVDAVLPLPLSGLVSEAALAEVAARLPRRSAPRWSGSSTGSRPIWSSRPASARRLPAMPARTRPIAALPTW